MHFIHIENNIDYNIDQSLRFKSAGDCIDDNVGALSLRMDMTVFRVVKLNVIDLCEETVEWYCSAAK